MPSIWPADRRSRAAIVCSVAIGILITSPRDRTHRGSVVHSWVAKLRALGRARPHRLGPFDDSVWSDGRGGSRAVTIWGGLRAFSASGKA